MLAIGYRLATASADLCPDAQPLAGFAVHDISQYGPAYRGAAAHAFGLGDRPAVLAVAPGGAAERAGLRPDDELLAVDRSSLGGGEPNPPKASVARSEAAADRIDAALADGEAALELLRGGTRKTIRIAAERGCRGRFQVVPGNEVNAAADGRYVQISAAHAENAANDAELASILAHELAHNILHHRERLDRKGISRGLFGGVGRSARLVRQTEIEADRLSVYLMDRAGYPPEAAVRFWRRFGPAHSLGIFASPTHPGWKERATRIEAEIATLARLKRESAKPVPPLLAGPLPELR